MKLASGIAPVPAMLAAGVSVGLGTDGAASNNDLDMFEAMRMAAFLHKVNSGDPGLIPAKTALEMATINGARALGLEKQIGSLEVGKRADVIVVSMAGARQTPVYNPISHLVYVSRGDDVQTTITSARLPTSSDPICFSRPSALRPLMVAISRAVFAGIKPGSPEFTL